MSKRTRSLLLCLTAAAGLLLAPVASAEAYWVGTGTGTGTGTTATMPAGNQPSTAVSGQSVTVSWPQSSFAGSPLGTYGGGGYTLRRYAGGSSTPIPPSASCATTIGGAGATLQCIESGVPYGAWQYTVTPVLNSFTGAESAKSAAVDVVTNAPVLATVVRADPVGENALGDLQLSWGAVTGATGYNVYRRTSAGTFPPTPLNVAPLGTTSFTDPGSGLATGTTYAYVVRAVAGSPVVQSAASNERQVTPTGRPAPPAGITAAAAPARRIDVSWPSVAGATGYNVYRRTAAGTFNYATRLGGATISGTTFADTTGVDGTSYVYVVRTVVAGADGPIESFSSAQSAAVTADGTPPAAPTEVKVATDNVLLIGRCSIAANTRFVNNASKGAVTVSAALAAPEPGATVHFSATTPGSSAVLGPAAAATLSSAMLDLTGLIDGVLTLTAYSRDAAGNVSAPTAMTEAVRKDVAFSPPLTIKFTSLLFVGPRISGNAECGANIVATKGSNQVTAIADSGNTWEVGLGLLGSSGWTATATDLAGNLAVPASD